MPGEIAHAGNEQNRGKTVTTFTEDKSEQTYQPSSEDFVKISGGYLERHNKMLFSKAKLYNKYTNTIVRDNIEQGGMIIHRNQPVTIRCGDEVFYWNQNSDIDLATSFFAVSFYFDEERDECFAFLTDGENPSISRKLATNLLLVPGGRSNFSGVDAKIIENLDVSKCIVKSAEDGDDNAKENTEGDTVEKSEYTVNAEAGVQIDDGTSGELGDDDACGILSSKDVSEQDHDDRGVDKQTEHSTVKGGVKRPQRTHRAPEKLNLGDDYHSASRKDIKRKKENKPKGALLSASKKRAAALLHEEAKNSTPSGPSSSPASFSSDQLLSSIDAKFHKHFKTLNSNMSRNIHKWVEAAMSVNTENTASEEMETLKKRYDAANVKIDELEKEKEKQCIEITRLGKMNADMNLEMIQMKDELTSCQVKVHKLQELNMKLQEQSAGSLMGSVATPQVKHSGIWESPVMHPTGKDFRYASSEVIEMLPEDAFSPSGRQHSQSIHPRYLREVTQPFGETPRPLRPQTNSLRGTQLYRIFK